MHKHMMKTVSHVNKVPSGPSRGAQIGFWGPLKVWADAGVKAAPWPMSSLEASLNPADGGPGWGSLSRPQRLSRLRAIPPRLGVDAGQSLQVS